MDWNEQHLPQLQSLATDNTRWLGISSELLAHPDLVNEMMQRELDRLTNEFRQREQTSESVGGDE